MRRTLFGLSITDDVAWRAAATHWVDCSYLMAVVGSEKCVRRPGQAASSGQRRFRHPAGISLTRYWGTSCNKMKQLGHSRHSI